MTTTTAWPGEDRRSRSRRTGTIVVLVDATLHPDFQADAYDGVGRWVTVCDDHGTICHHQTHRLACQFMPVPDEFCDGCRRIVDGTAHVYAYAERSDGSPYGDLVVAIAEQDVRVFDDLALEEAASVAASHLSTPAMVRDHGRAINDVVSAIVAEQERRRAD